MDRVHRVRPWNWGQCFVKPDFHMICNGLRSVCHTVVMVGKAELDSTFPTITTVSQTDCRPLQIIWNSVLYVPSYRGWCACALSQNLFRYIRRKQAKTRKDTTISFHAFPNMIDVRRFKLSEGRFIRKIPPQPAQQGIDHKGRKAIVSA